MKRLTVFGFFVALAVAFCLQLPAERTTRRGLKVDAEKIGSQKPMYDTITVDSAIRQVVLSGFDKPLRSNRETFFVINRTDSRIISLTVEFSYLALDGRMLHSRIVCVGCDIPAGETRQVSCRSWDLQQSFFYTLSRRPRQSVGTPFEVKSKVVSFVTPLPTNKQ